jgi:pentatricopeptide repeat protein
LIFRFARMDKAWAVATTIAFVRDNFTYTSLAKGLNQVGLPNKALEMIVHMFQEGGPHGQFQSRLLSMFCCSLAIHRA